MQSGDDDNYESDDLDEGEGKLDEEGLRRLEEDQKALLANDADCGECFPLAHPIPYEVFKFMQP